MSVVFGVPHFCVCRGGEKSNTFFEASLGASYFGFDTEYEQNGDKDSFEGVGPALGFKAGVVIGKFTVYANLELGFAYGDYKIDDHRINRDGDEYCDRTKQKDVWGYRTFLGMGTSFYPFSDRRSVMFGTHLGASAGFVAVGAGEVWPITESVYLGGAVSYTMEVPVVMGEDYPDFDYNTLWAGIRLMVW
ncbi:hypothetical protein [Fibrobacter sp. UWEL]|uniref:hypothetical protein n=1 Tax=Fibrobacter sp. UWEL TaxID=1896209 RepID=UPI00091CD6E2|nr:hypothetical protein [Fibrobacter sp. UWEL]SHL46053.1 hypothetical protein SAMN05720468_1308 [Fibrobacter sp. UWEL]